MTSLPKPTPTGVDLLGLMGLALLLGVIGLVQPDHVQTNEGLGSAGHAYATVILEGERAGTFWKYPFDQGLTGHLLPLLGVYHLLDATALPPSTATVVLLFAWCNVALLVLTAAGFFAACRRLGVARPAFWMAGVGLLMAFGVWKWPASSPVVLDLWAVALGTWMVATWLHGWTWGLAALTLAGAFIWPGLLVPGILLLLPCGAFTAPERRGTLDYVVAAVLGLGIAVGGWLALDYVLHANVALLSGPVPDAVAARLRLDPVPLLYRFNAAALGLLFGAAVAVLVYVPRGAGPWSWLAVGRVVVQLAMVLGLPPLAVWALAAPPTGYGLRYHLVSMVRNGLVAPLGPLVFYPFFFGALGVVAVLRWSDLATAAGRLGLGAVLCLAAALALSVGPQPRHLVHFFPFVAVLLAQVLGRYQWAGWQVAVFLVGTLALSRIWLPLGDETSVPFLFALSPFQVQEWFMIQAAVVALAGGVLAGSLRRPARPTVPAPAEEPVPRQSLAA